MKHLLLFLTVAVTFFAASAESTLVANEYWHYQEKTAIDDTFIFYVTSCTHNGRHNVYKVIGCDWKRVTRQKQRCLSKRFLPDRCVDFGPPDVTVEMKPKVSVHYEKNCQQARQKTVNKVRHRLLQDQRISEAHVTKCVDIMMDRMMDTSLADETEVQHTNGGPYTSSTPRVSQ